MAIVPAAAGYSESIVMNIRSIVKRVLQWHLPVGKIGRLLFGAFYRVHTTVREVVQWSFRFFWCEPLFRSQCETVGKRFTMEQLPYLVGQGEVNIGDDVRLSGKSSFTFSRHYADAPILSIGSGTFVGHNCSILVGKAVHIGSHCLIAGGVRISDFDGHPTDATQRRDGYPAPTDSVKSVTIGDDVWVGYGAMILKGVTVGDRAIVGARAVVTKDVDMDTVVAGNPARVVKYLTASRGEAA